MTTPEPWWKEVTGDEAGNCSSKVIEFLDHPNSGDAEQCGRALALYILLGGDEKGICVKADKVLERSEMNGVRDALAHCEMMLSQANVVLPEPLKQFKDALIIRVREAHDRWYAEVLRSAGKTKIRLRPK